MKPLTEKMLEEKATKFVDWYFGKPEHWSIHDSTRAKLMQEKLTEQFTLIREETVKEFRIADEKSIDCPMSVCCSGCYWAAVEHRIETITKD